MSTPHTYPIFSLYWLLMLIGMILIILSAFGIQFGPADLFKLGVAVCFGARFAS